MNRKPAGLLVAAALGTALLTACTGTASTPHVAPATTSTPTTASIAKAAQQYLAELVASQQFDGTVLLAVHGKVVFRGGFGTADTTTKTPDTVTPDTASGRTPRRSPPWRSSSYSNRGASRSAT